MSGSPLEAALVALRRGFSVRVGQLVVQSVETGEISGAADLLISGERAAALGLGNQATAAGTGPAVIAWADWFDPATVRAIIDPAHDFDRFVAGPLRTKGVEDSSSAGAALKLTRLAGLMPALWLNVGEAAVEVVPDDIGTSSTATIAARARLPLEGIGEAQIVAFREDGSGSEHVALVLGAWGDMPPLVRLHSECLTGDVFGSLKCDCGPQLKEALRLIQSSGGGVLLYLRQEGRGIGLVNKIRAYALQDRGLDTVEANLRLGFADDERDYGVAAAMLQALKIDKVRVLTNNPDKVAGLQSAGIEVVERVGHHMPVNPHNADYIAVKKTRSGHLD